MILENCPGTGIGIRGEFFQRNPVECARDLIGANFHWHDCAGRIVETEAYMSVDDPACHTWNRPSARRFIETHDAGAAYVYLNYGMYWLFNVLVKSPDFSGFVLLRAVEPLAGIDAMRARRAGNADRMLGAGPGRLTRALGIDGSAHGMDFLQTPGCGIALGTKSQVVTGGRIGISKAQELPWRFGDPDSQSLSRKF